MNYDKTQLATMDKGQKTALVNSLSGFKAANLVGTCSGNGSSNLAIMSSAVHLGSHPPLFALVLRPEAARQHTLANILETGVYTLNHVHEDFFAAAHQTAARYPQDVSEFVATGLTPQWCPGHAAPFVAEARVRMGMVLREHQTLKLNGAQLVIGEVVSVSVPEHSLNEDGSLDLSKAGTVALSGLDSYHSTERLARLAYAKPDLPPRVV